MTVGVLVCCVPSPSCHIPVHDVRVFVVGLGVSRVVVGRELSVAEISKVSAGTSAEVEAFCHGALCVSYSGQCFSSGRGRGVYRLISLVSVP